MFATVTDITGGSRMKAFCEDDKHRMVRIPGKYKKKMWCRVNDIIIIKKWWKLLSQVLSTMICKR